jgi:hypothetical protein
MQFFEVGPSQVSQVEWHGKHYDEDSKNPLGH